MSYKTTAWAGLCVLIVFASTIPSAFAAEPTFASAPEKAAHSSARLLSGGAPREGVYHAGVEVELEAKTITYWRQPGDAGTPPVFDFSQSENVAEAETLYPAPTRIVEAGVEVAGYERSVIFPVRVTPRDPHKPVTLKLSFDYAACGSICLPAKARLGFVLPMTGASPHAAQIAVAEALVPRKLGEGEARKLLALARAGDGAWRLRYLGAGRAMDIFAEAPEPFFLESARGGEDNLFELKLVSSCCQSARPADGPVTARVTLKTDTGAVEAPLRLE